jgi:hypothetical protein
VIFGIFKGNINLVESLKEILNSDYIFGIIMTLFEKIRLRRSGGTSPVSLFGLK